MPAVIKRQATLTSRALVLDPAARIRQLSDHGSSVEIDKTIPIKRYFRSGSEMERQVRIAELQTSCVLLLDHVQNTNEKSIARSGLAKP